MTLADQDAPRGPILREYQATYRVFILVVASVPGVAATSAAWLDAGAPWLGFPFLAVSCLAGWLLAMRPRICIHPEGLAIRNPLVSIWIDRPDITGVEATYDGLMITERSGRRTRAWAVQKPNWALMLKRQSGADRVAAVIQEWADGNGLGHTPNGADD